MLDNLIENALNYSPAGTTVTLSWARPATGRSLAVADEGPGIAPADRRAGVRALLPRQAEHGCTAGPGSGWRWWRRWPSAGAARSASSDREARRHPGGGAPARAGADATLPDPDRRLRRPYPSAPRLDVVMDLKRAIRNAALALAGTGGGRGHRPGGQQRVRRQRGPVRPAAERRRFAGAPDGAGRHHRRGEAQARGQARGQAGARASRQDHRGARTIDPPFPLRRRRRPEAGRARAMAIRTAPAPAQAGLTTPTPADRAAAMTPVAAEGAAGAAAATLTTTSVSQRRRP